MGKFGEVAIEAVGRLGSGASRSPVDAWRAAAEAAFPNSPSSADKGCPKGAFLGLCEDGLVLGAPKGTWTGSALNKAYAVRAVAALRADPAWLQRKRDLWREVSGPGTKVENGQLDVVFSLWRAGLIVPAQPG
jgi:hypothetical protein